MRRERSGDGEGVEARSDGRVMKGCMGAKSGHSAESDVAKRKRGAVLIPPTWKPRQHAAWHGCMCIVHCQDVPLPKEGHTSTRSSSSSNHKTCQCAKKKNSDY